MRNERSNKCAPRPPLCPSCAQVMRLARITSRFGDLPELYTFELPGLWRVAHRGSVSATILIMCLAWSWPLVLMRAPAALRHYPRTLTVVDQ